MASPRALLRGPRARNFGLAVASVRDPQMRACNGAWTGATCQQFETRDVAT